MEGKGESEERLAETQYVLQAAPPIELIPLRAVRIRINASERRVLQRAAEHGGFPWCHGRPSESSRVSTRTYCRRIVRIRQYVAFVSDFFP